MKCIVLAGGKGDRLWPLSRKSYPKQFIKLQKTHSMFQETIARNIPFCDEFVIVTNREYQFIIENQLSMFQGLTYSCIFEEVGRKTTAAIILACMQFVMSETVLVVPTDQLIEGEGYKDAVMRAKELSQEGYLVTLGMDIDIPEERFGYILHEEEDVLQFTEKPTKHKALEYQSSGNYFINSGTFVFMAGNILQELKAYSPNLYFACQYAFKRRKYIKSHVLYEKAVLSEIPAEAIEKSVFEKTKCAKVIHCMFQWKDIGSLEDLELTQLEAAQLSRKIMYECENTQIINQSDRSVVVANGLEDVVVVNTDDAVYIGKKEKSNELKAIIHEYPELSPFVLSGRIRYRSWGTYELVVDEKNYRVKKITINQGRTIYAHSHVYRSEHWSVAEGLARIEIDGNSGEYGVNDVINVGPGMIHQVSNIGLIPLIIIEVSVGENVSEDDMISIESIDLSESDLGFETEPYVKLQPAFKDYIWGGTKLKDIYGKKCDYDTVAESWELSAHSGGQSTIASGRHKGMLFQEYIEKVGKDSLGWKCKSMTRFPILIKFIDAKQPLSVQVHPDDDYALEIENEYGKNEMWYIIDCEKDAFIYCGFSKNVSKDEVLERLNNNTIHEVLNKITVRKGEVYFIPAGTVHAIGEGILICEIQQSSACTYRLYDYDRKDKYGNYRELHIDKALEVINYDQYLPQKFENGVIKDKQYESRLLCLCKYFECVHYKVDGTIEFQLTEESFLSIVCISGYGKIMISDNDFEPLKFKAGESIFLPKSDHICRIEGEFEAIFTKV